MCSQPAGSPRFTDPPLCSSRARGFPQRATAAIWATPSLPPLTRSCVTPTKAGAKCRPAELKEQTQMFPLPSVSLSADLYHLAPVNFPFSNGESHVPTECAPAESSWLSFKAVKCC